MLEQQTVRAEVLVLGGGGAGLRAAIAAREAGADVLLVSKSLPGKANNTAISGGAFAVPNGYRVAADNPAVYQGDVLRSGHYLNDPGLVRLVAEGANEQLEDLMGYGVNLKRREDGGLWITEVPGHSYPRHVFTKDSAGSQLTRPLVATAEQLGVRFLSRVMVTRLLAKDDAVFGAVGLDRQGRLLVLQAPAVVLACGGAGRIFYRTNNAPGIAGDGYALGYHLGLPLVDMEFVQFYPTCIYAADGRHKETSYEALVARGGAVVRNALGEDVAERHGIKSMEHLTRDNLSRAIMHEIRAGRGLGPQRDLVEIDISPIPANKMERYRPFLPPLHGRQSFLVSPVVHFFMGGLLVDSRAGTPCAGLFSAGEVNGGVHGANRLGGNALTEVWVFGALAGREAARYAAAIRGRELPDPSTAAASEAERLRRLAYGDPSRAAGGVAALSNRLRRVMWEKAGVIRRGEELKEALQVIEELKHQWAWAGSAGPGELLTKLELENMLLVAEMVARAALMRTESRGAHYRYDFPSEDPSWLKRIVVQRGADGGMQCVLSELKGGEGHQGNGPD